MPMEPGGSIGIPPGLPILASLSVVASAAENAAQLQRALTDASARRAPLTIPPGGPYQIAGPLQGGSNTVIRADGAILQQTTPLVPLIVFPGGSDLTISGGSWRGVGAATAFTDGAAGLIYVQNTGGSSKVRITDVEVLDAYTGISCIRTSDLWIERCVVNRYMLYGILASLSIRFHIARNDILANQQTGAANAYGIQATGDLFGGQDQIDGLIEGNFIDTVPAWDGIMTHDCNTLTIVNNIIRNVRCGMDLQHLNANNAVRKLVVRGNQITSTTTNTWGATPAAFGGILASGFSNAVRIQVLEIEGNTIDNFDAAPGMVIAGDCAHILAARADHVSVQGNIIVNGGSVNAVPGIYLTGTMNRPLVQGNVLQGQFSSGGIRCAAVTADLLGIHNNIVLQAVGGDIAVYITNSTATVSITGTITNAVQFFESGSTLTGAGYQRIGFTDIRSVGGAGIAGLNLSNVTSGAAAAAGTLANAPVAGNPAFWVPVQINGVVRHIPAW